MPSHRLRPACLPAVATTPLVTALAFLVATACAQDSSLSPSSSPVPLDSALSPLPQPTSVPSLPAFRAAECNIFRTNLLSHSDLTFFDRRHTTPLAIAAIALCWTGVPAVPLAIAALWMAHRMNTPARIAMLEVGVTSDNYLVINRLCAVLLSQRPLEQTSLDGPRRPAIIMAAIALALAAVVVIIQMCYGILVCCTPRYNDEPQHYIDDDDDDDIEEEELCDEAQDERFV